MSIFDFLDMVIKPADKSVFPRTMTGFPLANLTFALQ